MWGSGVETTGQTENPAISVVTARTARMVEGAEGAGAPAARDGGAQIVESVESAESVGCWTVGSWTAAVRGDWSAANRRLVLLRLTLGF